MTVAQILTLGWHNNYGVAHILLSIMFFPAFFIDTAMQSHISILFLHRLKEQYRGADESPILGGLLQAEAFVASKLLPSYDPHVSSFVSRDVWICTSMYWHPN